MATKIILFVVFVGLVSLSVFGFAHIIPVSTSMKMSTVTIDSPDVTLLKNQFKFDGDGNVEEISMILFSKETGLFEVSMTDRDGVELAYGSLSISDKNKFNLGLSNLLTPAERADLWNITYTIS